MRRTNNSGMGFAFVAAVGLLGILGAGGSVSAGRQDDDRNNHNIRTKWESSA